MLTKKLRGKETEQESIARGVQGIVGKEAKGKGWEKTVGEVK
ncbi:MAG: hypothetical protein PVS3B1_07600 [Ktedonobacteraceae bacterium]